MDKIAAENNKDFSLYPTRPPYENFMLEVDNNHKIYVEQSGNPQGIPVVVLHGGPGGGSSPIMRRFFNPEAYRIILFDQRGCGQSTPHASIEANTTSDLISDIETIRRKLLIDKWMVFGGSWGATLALLYAQAFPDHVEHLILRGVFLGTQAELAWFYEGGVARFWPELWEKFCAPIPENERGNMIAAYNKRLFCGDYSVESALAQSWTNWENTLASINNSGVTQPAPSHFAHAFARLENHYFANHLFLDNDNHILDNMHRISDIAGSIVQGRLDMVCPPFSAYKLHKNWPGSTLEMVNHAGHTLLENGIRQQLVKTMQQLATRHISEKRSL